MSQFARPDANVTQTNWTGGFAEIDEATFSDADAAYSADNTAGATLEVGLTNPTNPQSGTCTVRYRHAQCDGGVFPSSGGTATQVTCYVVEGTTVLVTDAQQTANAGSFLERSFTFATSLVTNWADVRLRWVTAGGGGATANRRGVAISFAEIETPDAGGQVYTQTLTDAIVVIDESSRLLNLLRSVSDQFAVSDSGERRTTVTVFATDVLVLLDAAIADYIPAGGQGQINTIVTDDGLLLTDSVVSALVRWVDVFDALAVADSAQAYAIRNRLATDGVIVYDSVQANAQATFVRIAGDDVGVVDSVLSHAVRSRLYQDSVVADDSILTRAVRNRLHEDVIAVSDSATATYIPVAGGQIFVRVMDDGIVLFDSGDRQSIVQLYATDALLLVDSFDIPSDIVVRIATDAVALTDGTLRERISRVIGTDQIVVVDPSPDVVYEIMAVDTIALSDAALGYRIKHSIVSDAIVLNDAAAIRRLLIRIATDALNATDNVISGAAQNILMTVSDSLSITDAVDMLRHTWRVASDALAIVDPVLYMSFRQRLGQDVVNVSDSARSQLSLTRRLSDAMLTSDDVLLQQLLTRHLSDAFGVSDGTLRAVLLTRVLEDAIRLVDFALSATTGLVVRVASDAIEITDRVETVRLLRRVLTDGFAPTDDAVRRFLLARRLTDTVDVTDTYTATKSAIRVVTMTGEDGLLVSDMADLFYVHSPVITDLILALSDSASYTRLYGRGADDAVGLTDSAVSVLRKVLLATDGLTIADDVAIVQMLTRELLDFVGVADNVTALYLADISLRYILRVRLGADQYVKIGAEAVAVIGHDPLPIEIGGFN